MVPVSHTSPSISYQLPLFKMKIINTEKCPFCNTYETLTHLFWECIFVDELWNKPVEWINSSLNVDIDIIVIDVIFGR